MISLYEILMTDDVDAYIASLDVQAMTSKEANQQLKRVYYQLELLERLGTRTKKEICRYLQDDLWELRPGDDRIIFFVWQNGKIVLLHIFTKKTQKMPVREIHAALRKKKRWEKDHSTLQTH